MNWIKISEQEFHLKEKDALLATMKLNAGKATCHIGKRSLQIHKKGFWHTQLELADSSGQVLTILKPVTWFGHRWSFHLYGQDYELLVRNNPLAEFAVRQQNRDVVAYGLKTQNGRVAAVISDHRTKALPEIDLLLWYLFLPVAQEATGNGDSTDLNLILLTA